MASARRRPYERDRLVRGYDERTFVLQGDKKGTRKRQEGDKEETRRRPEGDRKETGRRPPLQGPGHYRETFVDGLPRWDPPFVPELPDVT